jgi:hypothetical protein
VENEKRYWLDDPANVRKVYIGLWVVCIVVALLDLFYTKHAHYPSEEFFAFHAAFGFVGFAGLVFAGKLLRKVVMRDEDYYDE